MERKVIYSDNALDDIDRLYQFLYYKNPNAANRAVQVIRRKIDELTVFPYIGKKVKGSNVRRDLIIPFGKTGYIARYRIFSEELLILAIKHQLELGDDIWLK